MIYVLIVSVLSFLLLVGVVISDFTNDWRKIVGIPIVIAILWLSISYVVHLMLPEI